MELGARFNLWTAGKRHDSVIASIVPGKDFGPQWLTGGTYGIEGGAACTIALILSSLFLWRTHVLSATRSSWS
jgi:hypothetical protein